MDVDDIPCIGHLMPEDVPEINRFLRGARAILNSIWLDFLGANRVNNRTTL